MCVCVRDSLDLCALKVPDGSKSQAKKARNADGGKMSTPSLNSGS